MQSESIGLVIQARMGSTRLPGKVLMDFCGKPMLLFQMGLLSQYKLADRMVVATTVNPIDDAIADLCKTHRIDYVRGSEANVFERFQLAAEKFGFDHIARLTGDNPLTNYAVVKTCIDKHLREKPDLTSTRQILLDETIIRFVPKGNSVDVINCKTLLDIDGFSLNDFEKEHVIPVFFNGNYTVAYVKKQMPGMTIDLSIDDKSDYQRVCKYTKACLEKHILFSELGFEPDQKRGGLVAEEVVTNC